MCGSLSIYVSSVRKWYVKYAWCADISDNNNAGASLRTFLDTEDVSKLFFCWKYKEDIRGWKERRCSHQVSTEEWGISGNGTIPVVPRALRSTFFIKGYWCVRIRSACENVGDISESVHWCQWWGWRRGGWCCECTDGDLAEFWKGSDENQRGLYTYGRCDKLRMRISPTNCSS